MRRTFAAAVVAVAAATPLLVAPPAAAVPAFCNTAAGRAQYPIAVAWGECGPTSGPGSAPAAGGAPSPGSGPASPTTQADLCGGCAPGVIQGIQKGLGDTPPIQRGPQVADNGTFESDPPASSCRWYNPFCSPLKPAVDGNGQDQWGSCGNANQEPCQAAIPNGDPPK
jgi:hypothetical protein